jgi:hypothetical protein
MRASMPLPFKRQEKSVVFPCLTKSMTSVIDFGDTSCVADAEQTEEAEMNTSIKADALLRHLR